MGQWVKKSILYLKKSGIKGFVKKVNNKLFRTNQMIYQEYNRFVALSEEDIDKQRKESFAYAPLISIVVPVYRTKDSYLVAMIDSVKRSTYANWELILADGSGYSVNDPDHDKIEKILDTPSYEDERIRYKRLASNLGISENTNEAIKEAKGEWIAFADHDDLLSMDALYEMVCAMNRERDADFIYSDEDKTNEKGSKFYDPHFKPDFNLDLLRSVNYISHLTMMKRSLLEKTGYLRNEYDGAQDYDLTLRASEKAEKIVHVPKVLYHWRCAQASTANNMDKKTYALEAGRRALFDHLIRIEPSWKNAGIRVENAQIPGTYRVRYPLPEEKPLVSILIPNMDHVEDLSRCLDSVLKSEYENLEIIIIENNSKNEETFSYYEKMKKRDARVHVIMYELGGVFNFSSLNNYAADHAKGEYLLLMNNDIQMIGTDAISEMLSVCARNEVGVVGAKLLFPDETIQHAGVVIGFPGGAGHMFYKQPEIDVGYMGRSVMMMDYSAQTAACFMVRADLYKKLGGLDEEFRVAENDVDFCLRVIEEGYLTVYDPYARFYHFESKSRGYEDTEEKKARYRKETERLKKNHAWIFEKGDPCYNPALSLRYQDYSVKTLEELKGEL